MDESVFVDRCHGRLGTYNEHVRRCQIRQLQDRRRHRGTVLALGSRVSPGPSRRTARKAIRTLKRLPDIGVNSVDADSYGPDVSEKLIREAVHPYKGMRKGRPRPNSWVPNGRPDYLIGEVQDGSGALVACPFSTQDSSMLLTLARADALIRRRPFAPPAREGTAVDVIRLDFAGSRH